MLPVTRLSLNDNEVSWVKVDSEEGMPPVNWLTSNDNEDSRAKFDSEGGMPPVNWLLLNDNEVNRVKVESEGGMPPVNWLSLNDNEVSRVKVESEEGMLPVNLELERFNIVNCVSRPISLGIVVPLAKSPSLRAKLFFLRQSDKDERPIKLQAISSSGVAGGQIGLDVEGGDAAGDAPPMVLVRYITNTTTPTRNRQLPTEITLHKGCSRHFRCLSVKISA